MMQSNAIPPEQSNANPILYNIAVEGSFEPELIDWGNSPQWLDKYRDKLKKAERLSLLPKEGVNGLPILSIALNTRDKFIVFSRVIGALSSTGNYQIRLYALGYQRGKTKVITWVYPDGTIELNNEPSFAQHYLKALSNGK